MRLKDVVMRTMRTIGVAAVVLALAAPALAQPVNLRFENGRITLDASGVPVKTILAEWARLGGTKVINGDKVSGAAVTLRLEGVPEAQALEIILRNVAGYMAAPRHANSTGASAYDRILVLPTSAAPAATAAAARSGPATGNAASQRGPRVFVPPTPSDEPMDAADTGVNEPAAFVFPEQNPFQAVGQPGPFGTPVPPTGQQPVFQFNPGGQQGGFGGSGVSVNPAPPQAMPVLQFPGAQGDTGGFGVVGAPTPGVIVQPQAPPPGQRPPGGS